MLGTWDTVLDRLKQSFREEQYNMWFKNISCSNLSADTIEIEVPNDHYRNWIAVHYLDHIQGAIIEVLGAPREIRLVAPKEPHTPPAPLAPSTHTTPLDPPPAGHRVHNHNTTLPAVDNPASPFPENATLDSLDARIQHAGLNPEYTFDDFVVGPSNQFAHAASCAVAENPAANYNPLFFYGGAGLGKTHLMQAVGRAVLGKSSENLRVTYRTSEQFMNELIESINRGEMVAFRERYRTQCDVLLIDDIQFIAGKERTQEEFFHTFNALYNSGKQIIITSDKTPQEIPGLEDRLQSRFCWGLLADVQRPVMETRLAILKKKALKEGAHLPDDVALFLANYIDTNVRELEGAFKRVIAHAKLTGRTITKDFARKVLEPFLRQKSSQITPDRVLRLVAGHYNVKVSDIKGRRRARQIAYPRQIAMFLARRHTGMSYPELGRAFGKDHTTVLNAVQKIEGNLETDGSVKNDIATLERHLLA